MPGRAIWIWGHFAASPAPGASRIERGAAHADAFERMMVSDLRRAADRYPTTAPSPS
ncbi:hypothetical protein [Streptomyces sp. KL116D]|uniref:hypothetical protein n=1 Tax=Streptomyces sp. KL116D TaxID=3045152 RepID=UPI003556D4FD